MKLIITILEKLRYFVFYFIDYLKGSKIRKHQKAVSSINKSPFSEKSQKKRALYLNAILNHATNTTKYYNKLIPSYSINNFPVIDKNIIQSNFEDFISKNYENSKLIEVSTSGSTGMPFKVLQDKNKKQRNTADTIYFSKLVGYKVGFKLLYLRHWNKTYSKNKLIGWIQNIQKIEVLDLNNEYLKKLIVTLTKDKSNKSWIGFSSAFEQICKFLDKNEIKPLNVNMRSIVAISESLNDYTKKRMSYYFKAPVVSRYSNMENGIIGQQIINKSFFKVNWASYYIEVLDLQTNLPVKIGEIGRIVVTDLFNYAMPLIRYDTGDLGIVNYNNNEPYFKEILGRKTDVIYNTNGKIVSAFLLSSLNKFDGVLQYQLIQEEEKRYTVNLNIDNLFDNRSKISQELKKFLGDDATINIKFLNEIPILASGKRKVTVNNYYNTKS